MHDDIGDKPFGDIDLTTALTVSSDVFFYQIGAEFWDERSRSTDRPPSRTRRPSTATGTRPASTFPTRPRVWWAARRPNKLHAQYPKDYPYPQWYTGNNMELAFGKGSRR